MRSERAASAFSQGFAFFFNAEIRRQRGGARVRFAPSGKKGRFTLSSIFLAPRTAVAESECQCVFRSLGKELQTGSAPVGHPVGQKVS